ncbi:Plasmodium exported protein, unknown function [Plasmodium reichenowi]|uniref:Uncharacterized protein n=1 Tax=Plasmodium reichenowi TaxID=5854 RepID=A0A060RZ79_PLARE|nr:Plasmodium exported protein, unknown function [Plasmodium reichenowi]
MVHNNCKKEENYFFEFQYKKKKNKNEYFNLEIIIGSIINNRDKKKTETFFTFIKILIYIIFIYILYFIDYKYLLNNHSHEQYEIYKTSSNKKLRQLSESYDYFQEPLDYFEYLQNKVKLFYNIDNIDEFDINFLYKNFSDKSKLTDNKKRINHYESIVSHMSCKPNISYDDNINSINIICCNNIKTDNNNPSSNYNIYNQNIIKYNNNDKTNLYDTNNYFFKHQNKWNECFDTYLTNDHNENGNFQVYEISDDEIILTNIKTHDMEFEKNSNNKSKQKTFNTIDHEISHLNKDSNTNKNLLKNISILKYTYNNGKCNIKPKKICAKCIKKIKKFKFKKIIYHILYILGSALATYLCLGALGPEMVNRIGVSLIAYS